MVKNSYLVLVVLWCCLYLANAVIENEGDLITECTTGGHHQVYTAESGGCIRYYGTPELDFDNSELQCVADAPAGTKGRLAHLPSDAAAQLVLDLGETAGNCGYLGAKRINPSTKSVADWSWVEGGQVGDPLALTTAFFDPSDDNANDCMVSKGKDFWDDKCDIAQPRWCEFNLNSTGTGNMEPAMRYHLYKVVRSGARLSTSIIQNLSGVSMTRCSLECFQQGTVCGGYNYGSDKTCELTSTKIQDVPANEIISNAAFNRYE